MACDTNSVISHASNVSKHEFICGVVEGFYGRPWTCTQRSNLFGFLNKLKLNTFLYAPKNDIKHRDNWREMYSSEELSEFRNLIESARSEGIDFYYSLAPGLDVVYSDSSAFDVIVDKFEQLRKVGCKSFALLFDDIEPTMNKTDEKVFENYACAQVSLANKVFEHFNKPNFMFCPTEYCETRAIPSVKESAYLNTLGKSLHKSINVLWSGSRVISRHITEDSIDILTKVINRQPLIWENLHANDYDKKRIYLGPYSGRPTNIIRKLRGILTNPNCEYEANFIPIHTLAQWSKFSTRDDNTNLNDKKSNIDSVQCEKNEYDSRKALQLALTDWLPKFREIKPFPDLNKTKSNDNQIETIVTQTSDDIDMLINDNDLKCNEPQALDKISAVEIMDSNTCDSCDMQVGSTSNIDDDSLQAVSMQTSDSSDNSNGVKEDLEEEKRARVNYSLVDEKMVDDRLEFASNNDEKIFDKTIPSQSNINNNNDINIKDTMASIQSECKPTTLDDLSLLVDLFYLPFEHGSRGRALLEDLRWLVDAKANLLQYNLNKQQAFDDKSVIQKWLETANSFDLACSSIYKLYERLIVCCPNKSLSTELFPYMNELLNTVCIANKYVKFLQGRSSEDEKFDLANCQTLQHNIEKVNESQSDSVMIESVNKEVSTDGAELQVIEEQSQEPWIVRGGLIGDLQRLLPSS